MDRINDAALELDRPIVQLCHANAHSSDMSVALSESGIIK